MTLNGALEEVKSNSEEAKPNLTRIVRWIDENRRFLKGLADDNQVKAILVGAKEWHQYALIKGIFPDGLTMIPRPDQSNDDGTQVLVGEWADKPGKVRPKQGHEGHIHISFD